MPNTITSKSLINALRSNDYIGVDDTSNVGTTCKTTPDQQREYSTVGFGATFPIFSRKLAGVKTGANNCRVVLVGDSTTLGTGANATANQCVAFGWPSNAQRYFNKAGVTCQRDTLLGDGDGTSAAKDSRVVVGSSWGTGGAPNSLGGITFTSTTTTNALSFTPTGLVDTFIVYYVVFPGGGTLSVGVDAGSPSNQSTAGASAVGTKTVTATSPGIHTCNIKWVSGGAVFVIGIEAYNSTIKQLQIMNAGWAGAKAFDVSVATQPYNPLLTLGTVAPDLTIICIGINDWRAATSTTTFTTNIQSVITEALISGDCALMTPIGSNPADTAQATQDIYVNILRSLAATNNIPLIDIYDRFLPYSANTAVYNDNLHPNGLGYEIMGKAVFSFLNIAGAGSYTPMPGFPLFVQTVANNTYTIISYAGCAGTVIGVSEKARALTTAGTFAITINGTNITSLSAVVPTTAGSYTGATALNTFVRGDVIAITYSGTSVILDHTVLIDYAQTL